MNRIFIILFALIFLMPLHAEARYISLSQIDATLEEVLPHANGYPPVFTSDEQRWEISGKLKDLLQLLDTASRDYPDDNELLFRVAYANALGHNLEIPGCGNRAIDAFKRLIEKDPNNKRANLYYGIFLSQTMLISKSIPYLQRAIELGVPEAHRNLGFVYIAQRDGERALAEYKAYLSVHPDDAEVKGIISKLEQRGISAFPIKTFPVLSPGLSGSGSASNAPTP
ncbi:MAG TPA: tetratricopeptide repeat protein [Gallionella sp.]|nr:tetratricopeptide repeat protein [Gallionella sp.]